MKTKRIAAPSSIACLPESNAARRICIMTQTDLPYAAIVGLPHGAVGLRCTGSAVTALDYLPVQAELAPRSPLASEAVRQMRGEAAAQVPGAKTSLVHGWGGFWSACATVIFSNERP